MTNENASAPAPVAKRMAVPMSGAALWAVHLAVVYVAASMLCHDGRSNDEWAGFALQTWWVIGPTVLCALAMVPVLIIAARRLMRARRQEEKHDDLRSFLGTWSVVLNTVFLIAIVLEGIVVLWLPPCD
jgi:uncharacterized membrane protein YhaH (DUF805 family)